MGNQLFFNKGIDIMIEGLLIIICILLIIDIIKKHKYKQIDKEIQAENEKLLKDKETIINEIKNLDKTKEEKNQILREVENTISNMNAAAHDAFSQYGDTLDKEYEKTEQEYEKAIDDLKLSYDRLQDVLIYKIDLAKKDLDKISATRAAALEAQLKEQEIKDKQSFYCPQVPEVDLKDAKTLRDIEYKLNNPRVLRMLIWSTFYQKPMNQVCANVLGAATAEKCGIYKITNQKTDLVYIGQAVDIATR